MEIGVHAPNWLVIIVSLALAALSIIAYFVGAFGAAFWMALMAYAVGALGVFVKT